MIYPRTYFRISVLRFFFSERELAAKEKTEQVKKALGKK